MTPTHITCGVRVVNVYATPWRFNGKLRNDEGAPTDLSGLEQHYELYKEQLPRLLPDRLLGDRLRHSVVTLARPIKDVVIQDAKAELFALPSNQVVLAVTMCLANGVLTDERSAELVAKVLEQCIVGDIKIGKQQLADALKELFEEPYVKDVFNREARGGALLPERHQLVFVTSTSKRLPSQQVIDKILYRSTPPYRPEFVEPKLPKQLNNNQGRPASRSSGAIPSVVLAWRRRTGTVKKGAANVSTLGVVTPYVSLLCGHREYVEASIFLSTVHAVGTAARFRHIWRTAYEQVLRFREQKQKSAAGLQTRDDLEFLADSLGNLEFDLTFSVEFPLMRIETFQSDLYDAMDLANQAKTLSQMFDQLGGSLESELTAIEVREKRRAEGRQRWNSIAIGLLSLIGIPVSFIVAFLGINTTEVPDGPKVSMWDQHFVTVYLVASLFALTPVFLIAFPYLKEFALPREDRLALWWGGGTTVFGTAIFTSALVSDQHHNGLAQVIDAVATAFGVFFTLVGVTLTLMWAWRRILATMGKGKSDPTDEMSPPA